MNVRPGDRDQAEPAHPAGSRSASDQGADVRRGRAGKDPLPAGPSPPSGAGTVSTRRILRNSTLNVLGQGLLAVFNVIVVLILSRALSKDDFGRYYTVFALITAVQLISEAGIGTLLTYRIVRTPECWNEIASEGAWLFAGIILASTAVLLIAGGAWGWVQGDPGVLRVFAAAALACAAIQVQRYCAGVFSAFELFGYENIGRILQWASFAVLAPALFVFGHAGAAAAVMMYATSHVLAALYMVISLHRCRLDFPWRLRKPRALGWFIEAVPLGMGDLVRGLTWQLDTVLLGLLQPASVVGIYSVAYRPLGPLNWVPRAILTASFPAFTRMAAGDRAGLARAFSNSFRLLWIISLPIAIAICMCAEHLVVFLAGREYLEAAIPMRFLIWIATLSYLSMQYRFLFAALGLQRLFARLVTGVLAVEVVLQAALIPRWGYFGACAGSLTGEFAFTVVGFAICRSLGVGKVEWRAMLGASLAGAAMGGVLGLARDVTLLAVIPVVAFSTVLYFALCILLGALHWSEVRRLYQAFTRSTPPAPDAAGPRGGGELPDDRARRSEPSSPGESPTSPGPRRRASERRTRRSHGDSHSPRPLDILELEEALGRGIRRCDLWQTHRHSRIYRVVPECGSSLIAKQICDSDEAYISDEYRNIVSLSATKVTGLEIPRPIALILPRRAYLMEPVRGRSIADLFWEGDIDVFPTACETAGQVLARIHSSWTEATSPMPVDALARDLTRIPGGLPARARRPVREALRRLAPTSVAWGSSCLDFNPRNVFFHQGSLSLIDPARTPRQGILAGDIRNFRVYLRWELWKSSMARPWGRRRPLFEDGLDAFERGYLATHNQLHPELAISPLLIDVVELQQVAQLMSQRVAQLPLVRRERRPPVAIEDRRGYAAILASLRLLEAQKRWLIGRIARDLVTGRDEGIALIPGPRR